VPKDWQHPKRKDKRFIPLYEGPFSKCLAEWRESAGKWALGFRKSWSKDGDKWKPIEDQYRNMSFEEWDGQMPVADDYMPEWPEHEKTHLMMYETTSEGTPISPAFETPEELARWLADSKASAFGGQSASYEAWLAVAKGGYAPSAVFSPETGLISGVEALIRHD